MTIHVGVHVFTGGKAEQGSRLKPELDPGVSKVRAELNARRKPKLDTRNPRVQLHQRVNKRGVP